MTSPGWATSWRCVSVYYLALFVLSLRIFERAAPSGGTLPAFALLVPAHNEELVLEATLDSLVALDYGPYCVLVIDDGSTDTTSARARAYESGGRVMVVRRPPEVAGKGRAPFSITATGF